MPRPARRRTKDAKGGKLSHHPAKRKRCRGFAIALLATLCAGPASCARAPSPDGPTGARWTGGAADPIASLPDSVGARHGSAAAVALLAGRDAVLYLAWTTTRRDSSDLWLARSADLGEHFVAPVRVNLNRGTVVAREAGAAGPRCVVGPHDEIDAAWTGSRASGSGASAVFFARSSDGGATFAPAVRVDDGPDSTDQSFAALDTDERGRPWIAWLAGGRGPQAPPTMVRVTFSLDGGRAFLPSMAAEPLSMSARSGPAIAVHGDDVLVLCRAESDSARGVFAALSRDAGVTFAQPRLLAGDAGDVPDEAPALALLPGGRFAAAWTSPTGGSTAVQIVVAGIGDSAFAAPTAPAPPRDGVSQARPVLYARGRFLALAWQERAGGETHPAFCVSWDGGRTFSEPGAIGPPEERFAATPRLALAGVRHLIAVWSLDGPAGGLRLARTVLDEHVTEKGGT